MSEAATGTAIQVKSRWKPYPTYKDSGVKWLGEIPTHWKVKKLIHCTNQSIPIVYGILLPGAKLDDGVPYVGAGDVTPDRLKLELLPRTLKEISDQYQRSIIHTDELVYAIRGSFGNVEVVPPQLDGVNLSRDAARISPRKDISPKWLCYALKSQSSQEQFGFHELGATITGVNIRDLKRVLLATPPSTEQHSIVNFLDREIVHIDTLIAKKEQLIELLTENRTALISHAVTKGLDPTVPMKDSGVEWIGEIPAHWKITHLKYAASHIVDCPHSTPIYSADGDYHVIRTADVSPGLLNLSNTLKVDTDEYLKRIERLKPEARDIVYSREGERYGMAAMVPDGSEVCLGQRMMHFRVRSSFAPNFLMWQLNGDSTYRQAQQDTTGATSPHVNVDTIRNFWLSEPPMSEQNGIATFIDTHTAQIDTLISKVHEHIKKLKEYRTAIISAAVIGKIDVRPEVA